ncbi:MAG: AbrB/MazE/SpoVT family DNA-binding domain-containing protein [Candidatus Pacebacteria bacterium]|nr:AbrB/MazE/SpoVT family DNA-binding domain-containing protein [Candidatus Paceibacterota bacterium]
MNQAQSKKIQKITSRGQITLPISWRNKFKPDQIILSSKNDVIEIRPFSISDEVSEYTVFDAIRDNKGKGLKAQDLLKILNK